jgi:tRNA(Ile)-lysidine synthase
VHRLSQPDGRPELGPLIAAALRHVPAPDARLCIAVSGGPDSLALLILAAAAFPGRITAVTVDHGLRAAAAAEAASVAALCAARGLPHVILRRDGPPITANVQAQARAARYALLADWCRSHGHSLLLTAHHADDQAETLLMRLARGSGGDGLSGIRARRDLGGVTLLRPLLACRKADLGAIVAAAGWAAVDDPSNHDPRHDRTAVRALLAGNPSLDVAALAATAGHLAAEAEALAWAADLAWRSRVASDGAGLVIDARGLPAALVQRLLARAVARLSGSAAGQPLRGAAVARLAARLGAGQTGTLAGVLARPGPCWRLERAPARRKAPNSG